jgi:hypothetical protein
VHLHRIDENVSGEVAPLLAFLRELQRRHAAGATDRWQSNSAATLATVMKRGGGGAEVLSPTTAGQRLETRKIAGMH